MAVSQPEITLAVRYRCPNCQAELGASARAAQGWLRCPNCGRASLPPEMEEPPKGAPEFPEPDDRSKLGQRQRSEVANGGQSRRYPAGALRRIAILLGLIFSFSGALTGFFQGNLLYSTLFGASTLILCAIAGAGTKRR